MIPYKNYLRSIEIKVDTLTVSDITADSLFFK